MKEKALVWDPLVRIVHWLLLAAFVTSYLTGEEDTEFHFYSGYLILALLAVRIVWGFVGTEHAKFRDFVRSPLAAFTYLRGLVTGRAAHHVGHNPAAGLMILALLLSLLGATGSGLLVYGYEGHGPLGFIRTSAGSGVTTAAAGQESRRISQRRRDHDDDDEDDEHERRERADREGQGQVAATREGSKRPARRRMNPEQREQKHFWEEIHEFFANFTILLIFLHVAGVIASSMRHQENLLKSMISGYKERAEEAGPAPADETE